MKLYMHPASTTSRPVRLLLAEHGIEVNEEVVDLFTGAHHQEPFASFNPSRLVPVLEDGDLRLTESAAILRYLAEKFDLPEYPKDLKARAKVNEMLDWLNSNFYRDWGYNLAYPQLFPHHKRPSDEGHKVAIEWGKDKSAFWLQVLNDHFLGHGNAYLTGNSVTIADYFGASIIGIADLIRCDLSKYPNVDAWMKRMKAMPHWPEVSAVIDGYAKSLEGQQFVTP